MLSVEIRIDTGVPPHSFLVVVGPDGIERGYGFAPDPSGLVASGQVRDDTGHPSNVSSGPVEITQDQYVSLMNYISTTTVDPPVYAAFFGSQCSTWVVNALAQMGMVPQGVPNMQPSNILADFVESLIFNPWTQALLITTLKQLFHTAETIVSPIVLDLNGDGIATNALAAGAHFDHDANGFAEATGWVNAQDGILVRDLNGNGTIDTGRELFGSETMLGNGRAVNGYQALAELDTNQDGQINQQDAAYATLQIWKDANGDGYSSADELYTLADAGVQSIATGYTFVNQTDANGNITQQTGTFTKTDGSTGATADIWFNVNKTNTIATDWLPETAAVAALPDLQGFGNVYDLHQAMLRDSTGHLQDLVQQFINETDTAARHALTNQLIYAWVGVENIDPNSRGYIEDARQLYVLEAFLGEGYTQGYGANAGTPNTGWNAGTYLTGVYNELADSLYSQLMAQTHFKPLLDSIGVTWSAATNQFDWDITNTIAALQTCNDADPANDAVFEMRGVG